MSRLITLAGWRSLVLATAVIVGATRPVDATLPRIDPSGERVFLWDSPYHGGSGKFKPEPAHPTHKSTLFMRVAPARVIAPVGAEVVLIASICAPDGYMRANERVEWMLAPGGVGQFVALGERGLLDCIAHPGQPPRKLDNSYALGTTSARYISLTRGTPTYDDDVPVQKGQAWVTVTSPVEGVSYVTAYAPSVFGWDQRQRTSTIYWVDAQWQLPPPATNPIGSSHAFTTLVTRQTDRAPLVGWKVRYEITGGPAAGFAPDNRPAIEVPTDSLGQATAEIVQLQPAAGTNTVSIQIIRPPELPGGYGQQLVVGSGLTTKTWSTAGNLTLRMLGPSQATTGSTVTFRAEIGNPGALSTRQVTLTNPIPKGLTFISSNPPAQAAGGQLVWQLGDLGAGAAQAVEIDYRADDAGMITNCVSLATGNGTSAQSCATTTITATAVPTQSLSLTMTAQPQTATVGQDVVFTATLTNQGAAPTPRLVVVDRFDPGLQHARLPSPIEQDIDPIPAGQSHNVEIVLRPTQAGRLNNTIEVLAGGALIASRQASITVGGGAAAPPAGGQSSITVEKRGPTRATVGQLVDFLITITNTGSVPVTRLRLRDTYDLALEPTVATEGSTWIDNDLVWELDTLPAGQKIAYKVQCRCKAAMAKVCNNVAVTTAEGAQAQSQACLEVTAAAAATPTGMPQLSVDVVDMDDPTSVGRTATYNIKVSNIGAVADSQIALTVTLPTGLTPQQTGANSPSQATIDGNTVRFAPVASLKPGDQLTYQVIVRADQPGQARVRATVQSTGIPGGVAGDQVTTVYAQ